MNHAERSAIVRRHVVMLREHFDSVQIVCVAPAPDDCSVRYSTGAGSWYERFGAIRETAIEMDAIAKAATDPTEDDDEEAE